MQQFHSPARPSGFCGRDLYDAQSQCHQPCSRSSDCCDPSDACFATGAACPAADYAGKGHYYCGSSWCGAMDECGIPCPGGTDEECPVDQGCFADVPCANSLESNSDSRPQSSGNNDFMTAMTSNFANSNVHGKSNNRENDDDDNPHNFFCGASPSDAARQCIPCPSGEFHECSHDFTHGCFKGIAACAGRNNGNSGNSNNNNNNVNGAPQTFAEEVEDRLGSQSDSIVDQFLANLGFGNPTPPVAWGDINPPAPRPSPPAPRPSPPTPQTYYQPTPSQPTYQATQPTPAAPRPQPTPARPQPTPAAATPRTMPPWTNAPFAPTPGRRDKTVIGYYASWQWYDRNKFADPVNIDFSKYDRINYAFFQPDTEGNLYGTDEWADPQLLFGPYDYNPGEQIMSGPNRNYFCSWDGPQTSQHNCNYHDTSRGLITLAHRVGTEVMPSIGGWTLSDNFPGIAASSSKRRHFAQQCVRLIEAYGFDGIDLDWEYPGYEDHSGTPADTVNFTLLLREMRRELDRLGRAHGRFYGLTAALPCGPDKIEKIQVDQIKDVLTELNLMTYDLHGAWDKLTGTNAPMFDQGWTDKTPRWSVHGCVNNYVDLGVPLSKMNIGLPFYGRSFRGATGMKQFHGGADDINYHLDEGSPQYFNIVNELGRMTTYRHEKTQTQYATFNIGGGVVSYDDPRAICDKVDYANQRGMHGFLIWEISGDMLDDGSTPLIDATNAKIRDPRYDCSRLRDPAWALADARYRYAPDEPRTVDWSRYEGPSGNAGSANDFNGAQEPAPAPVPAAYHPPANAVWTPPGNSGSGGNAPNAPAVHRPSGSGCPRGGTGYYPSSDCSSYMYCSNGVLVGAVMPCVPGTRFDVDIGVCTYPPAGTRGCAR